MMGLIGFFVHRKTKNDINNAIRWYRGLHSDVRGGAVFYLWLTRGFNLAEFSGSEGFIPIYYYQRAAVAPLTDLIRICQQQAVEQQMVNALQHHYWTNLAAAYPDHGYWQLVEDLWGEVLNDLPRMEEVAEELEPRLKDPNRLKAVQNNDVSLSDLVKNPSSIKPHFMVPGHALSKELLEKEKIARTLR